MGSDRELDREILRKLTAISEKLGGSSSFASSLFVRNGDSGNDSVNTVRKTITEMDNFRESIKEATGFNKKVFKSILDGIPVYGKYHRAVREATASVEKQSKGQSEAFKQSASAMNEFAANVGANSKVFKKVTMTMAAVHESTNKLKDLTKKRMALEEEINASLKALGVRQEKIDSEYRDLPKVLKDVKERIKKETDTRTRMQLEQTRNKLEKLNEIPEAMAKLTKVMNDSQLKKLAEKHPELKTVLDPVLKRLESLLTEDESGARRRTSMGELESKLENSTGSTDELKGALSSSTTWMEKLGKIFDDRSRSLERAMENLRKSLSAALGESVTKEVGMIMLRQRFTGNSGSSLFGTEGYAARKAAIGMGMSETDLLSSVAENRNVIRRIAQDSGMARGAGELLHSGGLRNLQRLSREMGYMGKEGLDNIIKVSDDLRLLGVVLDPKNIRDSVEFYRDTFKDLGITQEHMREFFAQMSGEGMLRALSAGDDARLASVEAMQNEVEFRGKLARVLNQELEIQQKRVRELSGLAYGGPGEAIKRSIGVQILAEQAGMDSATIRLLGEQTRTGGVSLTEGERRRAATSYNQLVGDIGGLLHGAVRTDDTGMRAMLTQVMGMAGIDGREAVQAYIARGGDIGDLSVSDVLGSARAETERVSSKVGEWGHATVTTLEHMQGVLQSSIGNASSAIVSAIWQALAIGGAARLGASIVGRGRGHGRGGIRGLIGGGQSRPMATRGRSIGSRVMGVGGRLLRGGGPLALGGAALSSLSSLTPEGSAIGSAMRTGGNIAAATGTGAMIGSFVPVIGTAVGAALGAIMGTGAEILSYHKNKKEKEATQLKNTAVAAMAMGNFGAEKTPEISQRERELRKQYEEAMENNDHSRMRSISQELKYGNVGVKGRSLMQNWLLYKDSEKYLPIDHSGGVPDFVSGPEETERSKRFSSAIEQDIVSYLDSNEFKNLTIEEPIRELIEMIKTPEIEIENEKKTLEMLNEKLETIALNTELGYKAVDEGNQDLRTQFSRMDEQQIRDHIESSLTGQINQVQNRIIGRISNVLARG